MGRGSTDGGRGAFPAALRFLGRKAASREELRRGLERKGFEADEIAHAIARVESAGLLRERRTAEAHARTLLETRALGRGRIGAALRRRGFPEPDVAAALGEIAPEDEAAALERAVERVLRSKDPGAARRARAALLRRGFRPADVRDALRRAGAPPDGDEFDDG